MYRRQWLFRSCNEVLVCLFLSIVRDLVELFVELLKLRGLRHALPKHEVRGLVWFITLVPQEF